MRLRLYENYRFVLYAPFYAAHTIGAYAAEGLAVELLPSPGMGLAERALLDGAVEVIWAGPMRVMKHHDENPGSALVCFAEVVCRDPFSIVGRYPNPGFRLADLAQMRLATVSEVPTPWLCLQEDLRQAGIDPARLDRIVDRSMAENLNALSEGRIDAAQFFEPILAQIAAAGLAMEVNTAGWRKPVGEQYPAESILQIAVARQMPITTSSDAHSYAQVAEDYSKLEPLLERVGLEKPVRYWRHTRQ